MTKILTNAEIADLTGAKNKDAQKKVLAENGIRFIVRADGRARTTWDAVNAVLVDVKKPVDFEPNLEFLKR